MTNLLARLLTRSFPGSRDEVLAPSLGEDLPTAEDSYESRAFAGWNELIEARGARKILDLGPLRPQALAFFSERSIDLGILRLESGSGIISQLEQFDGSSAYQGLLAWDLPNYCADVEEFTALGNWLADHLTTGAPAFLSLSTKTPYGTSPATYDVRGTDRLHFAPDPVQGREVLFSGSRLTKSWEEFEVKRSFLLRNGMQEFVLIRR